MTSFLFIVITRYEEEERLTNSGVQTDGEDDTGEEVEKEDEDDHDKNNDDHDKSDKKSHKRNEDVGAEKNNDDDNSAKTLKPGLEKQDGNDAVPTANQIISQNKTAENKTPDSGKTTINIEPVVGIKLTPVAQATVLSNGPKIGATVEPENIHLRERSDITQKPSGASVDPVCVRFGANGQGMTNNLNSETCLDGYINSENASSNHDITGALIRRNDSLMAGTEKKGRFNVSKIALNQDSGDNETEKLEEKKEEKEEENEEENNEILEDSVLTPLVEVELPLFKKVQDTLEAMGVLQTDREIVGQRRFLKLSFILDDSQTCERVLNRLNGLGVGSERDSSVRLQ